MAMMDCLDLESCSSSEDDGDDDNNNDDSLVEARRQKRQKNHSVILVELWCTIELLLYCSKSASKSSSSSFGFFRLPVRLVVHIHVQRREKDFVAIIDLYALFVMLCTLYVHCEFLYRTKFKCCFPSTERKNYKEGHILV